MTIIEMLEDKFLGRKIRIGMPIFEKGVEVGVTVMTGKVKDIYLEYNTYHTDGIVMTFDNDTDCYIEPYYDLELC